VSRREEKEEEPSEAIDAFLLTSALRKLQSSDDDLLSLPAVVRTRGIKRVRSIPLFFLIS
jgi:hypothetical protein